jgi:hypothetical protein
MYICGRDLPKLLKSVLSSPSSQLGHLRWKLKNSSIYCRMKKVSVYFYVELWISIPEQKVYVATDHATQTRRPDPPTRSSSSSRPCPSDSIRVWGGHGGGGGITVAEAGLCGRWCRRHAERWISAGGGDSAPQLRLEFRSGGFLAADYRRGGEDRWWVVVRQAGQEGWSYEDWRRGRRRTDGGRHTRSVRKKKLRGSRATTRRVAK